MTLDHRSTSADIARHVYTDDDHRAHEALMGDLLPPETRVYPPASDYVQDWQRGTLARCTKRDRRSWIFPGLLIAAVAVYAVVLAVGVLT